MRSLHNSKSPSFQIKVNQDLVETQMEYFDLSQKLMKPEESVLQYPEQWQDQL
jgi:hypothetical protein